MFPMDKTPSLLECGGNEQAHHRHDAPVHQEMPRGGVDFTITGEQIYYPYTNRDLADTIRMTERRKPICAHSRPPLRQQKIMGPLTWCPVKPNIKPDG